MPKSTNKIRKTKNIYPHTFSFVKEKGVGVYLDYAASVSANPSSIHTYGVEAKAKLENARREVALVVNARPSEIIFTSGGTESNNIAIQGVLNAAKEQSFLRSSVLRVSLPARPFKNLVPLPHMITTNIEHPSVLETFKILERRGLAEISIVPVEINGIVDPKKIQKEIKSNTVLVSVMYANNEIGTIQPIKEIAKTIRRYRKQAETEQDFLRSFWNRPPGRFQPRVPLPARPFKNLVLFPLLHTDAVQAVNYLDISVEQLGVDMLSLSGSKIEGSGRVGILYKKKYVDLAPVYGGGDQEMGLRPGTENLPEILKFSAALELAQKMREKESKRLTQLRDYFLKQLEHSHILKNVGMFINGDLKNRLPNNINITFSKIPSDLLVIELSARRVMTSSKSACKSSKEEGSYVIKAIHPEIDTEIGGLRFSLGRDTTKKDIDYTIKALTEILTKLKKWYN